jgi:[protein-PII] uridylyltransferase
VTDETRLAFERARDAVASMDRTRADPDDVIRSHTADVDAIVIETFTRASDASDAEGAVALVALGGYGRRELSTGSDLDLLLLHNGWKPDDINAFNRAVMYPLWDSGRDLGDRIRTPRDVVRNIDRVDELCALIDARYLAGERALFADLEDQVRRHLERTRHSFFRDLAASTAERHERFGHAGHLLEPNIRDSAGGLRDVQTLGWASRGLPGADGVAGLVASGFLSARDGALVDAARRYLLRVRIELHLLTARHQDQLYLGEQDEIALILRYETTEARPAANRLMQELYEHARTVDAIVASFWDQLLHATRRRRLRRSSTQSVGDGCILQGGRLEVVAVTSVGEDPAGWLRVFRRSIRSSAPIGRMSIDRLHEELDGTANVRWSAESREVFFDILASGEGGERALEAMDLCGFLAALVPDWRRIRAYPQRDLYHRFTVDRHLFRAMAELVASRSIEDHDVRSAWARVGDADALYLATLLHDIGKGRTDDHSVVGAEIVKTEAQNMGLRSEQCDDAEFLVAQHLLLPTLATRRDLTDPRTISDCVERVGSARRLAMLYLLTRADSLATGPEAWSSFRSSLVRELYARALERFEGVPPADDAVASTLLDDLMAGLDLDREAAMVLVGPMPDEWLRGIEPDAASRQLQLLVEPLAADEVRTALHSTDEADEFIVVAKDRPGLFSIVTGALALRGIDVHDAEVYTRLDGIAVEVFRVIGAHGAIPDDRWARVRGDIAQALNGSLDLDAELAKKTAHARRRREGGIGRRHAEVVVDNHASESHTVIEIHTADRVGLLRTITKVLADAGCDLSLAKVATYGVDVVDAFYVRDLQGRKITDGEALASIEQRLHAAVGEAHER